MWFTPTCVGNTDLTGQVQNATTVHPHVCGEYSLLRFGPPFSSGSPPRVWGIRLGGDHLIRNSRFTPTCVGNTTRWLIALWAYAVHPHVCGEYKRDHAFLRGLHGSPPRVWGIHHQRLTLHL